jgi:hypothetical protein
VRHRLLAILGLAVCAVLGGAGSFTAIAEWAADADQETLARRWQACPRVRGHRAERHWGRARAVTGP